MRSRAVLAAVAVDAAAFCSGYALVSSLLVAGPGAVTVVDPRIFPDGSFNARVVVSASVMAGLVLVFIWRTAHDLHRRRQAAAALAGAPGREGPRRPAAVAPALVPAFLVVVVLPFLVLAALLFTLPAVD